MSDVIPPTEAINPQTKGLDLLETRALVETIVADQRAAVDAVLAQSETLARVVDAIARRLAAGGELHYVGAGSSGRIGVLDAAEMPPTFGVPHDLVRAHIAGGSDAFVRAVEGAEDDAEGGADVADSCVNRRDVVLGISASGSAAFVDAAVERAREKGALTIALTSYADSPLARRAEIAVILETGAEVLTGSTRLKAGTSQKIALNTISTAVMVRLNKIYDNLMVDVVATNRKLRARAIRLIQTLVQVDERRARELLESTAGRVKVAVVMERRHLDAQRAQELLERHDGSLRAALE